MAGEAKGLDPANLTAAVRFAEDELLGPLGFALCAEVRGRVGLGGDNSRDDLLADSASFEVSFSNLN